MRITGRAASRSPRLALSRARHDRRPGPWKIASSRSHMSRICTITSSPRYGRPRRPDTPAQRPTSYSGQAQCDIIAGSLGDLHRLPDRAQRGVIGQKHPVLYRVTVGPGDDTGEGCLGAARAIATASFRSCRHPECPSHHRATPRYTNATASGDPTPKPAPLAGSPSARSMTVCDHRRSRRIHRHRTRCRTLRTPAPWSRWDHRSTRAAPSVRMPAATPHANAPRRAARSASPVMPMASETLSPAALHNSRSSAKRPWPSWTARARQAVAHTAWCAGRCASTDWSGSSAGSASAMRRARSQLSRAAPISRLVDHAAARMCQP